MNKEAPYRQKTDHTRRRIGRTTITEGASTSGKLPPRSEIHHQKRKKSSKKVSFPLIRIQVIFFILLPITIFALYTYRDQILPSEKTPVSEEKSGYETITVDNEDSAKNSTKDTQKSDSEEKAPETNQTGAEEDNTGSSTTDNNEPIAEENNQSPSPQSDVTTSGDAAQQQTVVNDASGANATPETNTVEIKQHTVQTGETLYRIAMKYYQSKDGVDIIKKANNLTSNEIRVGQVLKIPIQ
ncbi:LysM peptidoglycan-binding domain-containing protein [Neobacillus sp. LXY-4]|uniref:LysM peptidoglycan-binding domain-containing protein n=1 Tax=Neobacillus sp. LXY-4 TaxID=3379826 RepID=UPI003EE0F89E